MAGIFWPRRSRQGPPAPPELGGPSARASPSERRCLANTASRTYGSHRHHAIEGVATKRWEWEDRGDPWELLKVAATSVGRQFLALGVIAWEVFAPDAKTKRFMSCDGRELGPDLATVCECTKASARFFPVLAMLVSLMVAVRMILRCRIYYEMLKHNVLVDFENPRPLRDPLFQVLLGCIVFGFSHFLTSWIYSWCVNLPSDELLGNVKGSVIFYFAPTAAFLAFLFNSYDTEAALLPLSKYMEEDPEAARSALAHIAVISEASAIRLLRRERLRADDPGPCTAKDLYMALASNAATSSDSSDVDENDLLSLFVTAMWPARVLLDSRLADEESLRFRKVWHIILAAACPVMLLVLSFFVLQGMKDVKDVQDGQTDDVGALLVELVYFTATCWLMHVLYLTLTVT